ncbi:MAG: tRNA (adenosine(37)-N6)-dimethylallyltransferase MiaA [Ignavibacteria bacterium]|nr:tRNA (adenosine(37)-N6)-dimethylallyltransferase MiaA [Ignavibacteria bacterium]
MGQRVIIITGPTCSGKTEIALRLARYLHTEIISADSRQIYRTISIGTAKPGPETLTAVPHHLIDFLELTEAYNAGSFEQDALRIIDSLTEHGKIPVVAGGTGLYIKALTEGIVDVQPDEALRAELHKLRTEKGNNGLYELLNSIDPETAEMMLPVNWKRVMRAIEVKKITGASIRSIHQQYKRVVEPEFIQFCLNRERGELYDAINARVDAMMDAGLLHEALTLFDQGLTPELNSLNTVGYKELYSYYRGQIDLAEAVRQIKRNTRHYAKRQLTWFRGIEDMNWVDILPGTDPEDIVLSILKTTGI